MTTNPTHKDDVSPERCLNCREPGALRCSRDGEAEWVVCTKCGREGPVSLNRTEAIAMWNEGYSRESARAQPAGLVDALKERLRSGGPDRDEWTDAGMEDAFFRWPVIERELRAALTSSDSPVVGEDELAFFNRSTCSCKAAQRYDATCPKHGSNPTPTDTDDRREAAIQTVLLEARENGADSPMDYGDAEQIVDALIAASLIVARPVDDTPPARGLRQARAICERVRDESKHADHTSEDYRRGYSNGAGACVHMLRHAIDDAERAALTTAPTAPVVPDRDGLALALVTIERAEHGLEACSFDALTDADQIRYRWRAERLASLIAGPPEGFVAVPVEPTDQMTLAGSYAADALGTPLTRTANAYRAMIAARPNGEQG